MYCGPIVSGLLCGGMSFFFLVIGVRMLVTTLRTRAARRRAVPAEGVVLGHQEWEHSEGGTCYDPIVRYRDAAGTEHTATVKCGGDRPFAVNQTVRVEYDPVSAQTVWLSDQKEDDLRLVCAWGFIALGGFGLLFQAAGLLLNSRVK